MPELMRTTDNAGKKPHFHVVYLRDDNTGISTISGDKPHFHQVIYTQAVPAVIDPETGIESQPEVPGKFSLAKENGHTHEIVPFIPAPEFTPTDNKKAVKKIQQYYKEATEREKEFFKEAKEDEEFISCKQWDKTVIQELENQERSHLMIDKISGKLDVLSGYQRQNRMDIKYFPRKGGTQRVADIFTQLIKIDWDNNNADYAETEVFEDQSAIGRGIFNCYISNQNSITGEIIIENFPWDGVRFGPHLKKDCSDLEYFVKHKWISYSKLKSEYPEDADKINKDYDLNFKGISEPIDKELVRLRGNQYEAGNTDPENAPVGSETFSPVPVKDKEFVDTLKKEYLLMELTEKQWRHVPIAIFKGDIDPQDDNPPMFNLDGYSTEEIQQIKTIQDVAIVKQPTSYIRVTVVAGGTKLDEYKSDINEFGIIPVYAKKRRDWIWGKVRNLKDPQREINKRRSQSTDIINKSASYVEYYDDEIFGPNEAKDYKKNANKPGHLQKVKNIERLPKQKEGVKFPAEIVQMEKDSSLDMREISNISPELQGLLKSQQSGSALVESKRQSLMGNEFLFDNLALGRRMIGRWYLQAAAMVYTAKQILEKLDYSNGQREAEKQAPIQVGGKNLTEYNQEELAELEEELARALDGRMAKYDVKVGESASSPTKRYENMLKLMELRSMGGAVPLPLLLEFMDIPPDIKEQVLQYAAAEQQAAAQAEASKNQTEIVKTIIANSNKGQGQNVGQIQPGGQM